MNVARGTFEEESDKHEIVRNSVKKIIECMSTHENLKPPYRWTNPAKDMRLGRFQTIDSDSDTTSRLIGWVIDQIIPIDEYPKIAFHVKSVDNDSVPPGDFSDEHFYVEDREDPRKSHFYQMVKDTHSENLAEDMALNTPDVFYQWIEESGHPEMRVLAGPIGCGKTTFLKHTMLEYLRSHRSGNNERLFLYLDCNPYISRDYRVASETEGQSPKWWEIWFADHLYKDVVSDFVCAKEKNTDGLLNGLSVNPKTREIMRAKDQEDKAAIFADFRKNSPALAIEHLVWYLKTRFPECGEPFIIIDNSDPGPTVAQQAASDLFRVVSHRSSIKSLVCIRSRTWFALNDLPHKGALTISTYLLSQANIRRIIEKRLKNLMEKQIRADKSKMKIIKKLQKLKYVARIHPSAPGWVLSGTLKDNFGKIVDGALDDRSIGFLNMFSNGNIRTAIMLVRNFFRSGGIAEESLLRFILSAKPEKPLPSHRFVRRLLTQGQGYISDTGALDPRLPINLFKQEGCDRFCHKFVRIRILREISQYHNVGVAKNEFEALYPICRYFDYESERNLKTKNCFLRAVEYMLKKGLINSTSGSHSLEETFSQEHRLVLSPLGGYYLRVLLVDTEYLACTRYDGRILSEWSGAWEDPTRHDPILWKLASNAEFVSVLAEMELKYLQDLLSSESTERNNLSRSAIGGYSIMYDMLEDVLNVYESREVRDIIENLYKNDAPDMIGLYSEIVKGLKRTYNRVGDNLTKEMAVR